MSTDFSKNGPRESAPESSSGEQDGHRLPPPAFPPGARRSAKPRTPAKPDDMSSAFISPDAPIPQRPPRIATTATEDEDADEGVVTGMGDDAHMDPTELMLGFDPHVLEVVDKVAKLAEALKQRGEAGLRSTPDMSRFEATLRSYCVGYLAGRRAEDEEG